MAESIISLRVMPESEPRLTDGHVHTVYCRHATGRMEDYVETAIRKGLGGLVFLEHLEIGINYPRRTWLLPADFVGFRREVEGLREIYQGKIDIGIGVEVGWNPERSGELLEFITARSWDLIGFSYHFMVINGRHYNLVSRRQSNIAAFIDSGVEKVLDRYFDGIEEGLTIIPADTLCHLDAPLRYIAGVEIEKSHGHRLARILDMIRQRSIALEVNCSGLPLRGEPFPTIATLEKARDMGIPFTLGSDAHRPGDVGRYFDSMPGWIRLNCPR